MKRLYLLVFLIVLASCFGARASTNVVATVAFTNTVNGVTNGGTITINGDQRNYTNGVLNNAAIWIQSTNIVGWVATNTLFHLGAYRVADVYSIQFTNSTNIVIEGEVNKGLTVTLSAGIGTVSYVTNTFEDLRPLMLPLASLPTAAGRTNQQNRLAVVLNDSYATGKVLSASVMFTNFVNLYNHQTLSNKTVYGLTNSVGQLDGVRSTNTIGLHGTNNYLQGGILDGNRATNVIALAGTNHSLYGGTYTAPTLVNVVTLSGTIGRTTNGFGTNWVLDSPIMTNGVNYGTAFSSPGSGTSSEEFGAGASASGASSLAVGASAAAPGIGSIAIGTSAESGYGNDVAIGTSAASNATNGMALGNSAIVGSLAVNGIAFGQGATVGASHTNSIAFGQSVTTTKTNQIMLGASTHLVTLPGRLEAASSTNNFLTGSNRFGGSFSLTRRTDSSQPTGHNIITNSASDTLVWLTAPAGACTNVGFTDGFDGRVIRYVKYNGGYFMGIANESGLASAERRVLTGTGADVTITNSPGWFDLMYDATLSRWILIGKSN